MRIVVGATDDTGGDDALAYAVLWARAARSSLVVTHVMPRPWPAHNQGAVDAEWVAYLRERADVALDRARALVPADVEADYVVAQHSSSGRGLAEITEEQDGRLIVIGSAPGGTAPHIRLGSTADQLLHGGGAPVTVVPEGYAARGVGSLDRISVAYEHSVDSDVALVATRQVVGRTQLPVRLLTLVQYPPRLLPGSERMLDTIRADARLWLEQARASLPEASAEIAEGEDVATALGSVDWSPGDTLLVGSADYGPIRRVFLGDTATRILRAATVPVTVLPRDVEPELESTTSIPRVR
jgi:nucleotide-binding universal stress UspA family protein